MTKIIVTVLAILLTFFPNSSFLLSNYQNLTFLGEDAITDTIVEAINNNDADTIEAMLSQHTKENGENLNSKIKELIAAIDGNIIEYYDSGNGGDGEVSDGKAYVKDTLWSVYLKTDTGNEYQLYISWVIANTANPNKVGMKTMGLCDMNHNSLVHLYTPNN